MPRESKEENYKYSDVLDNPTHHKVLNQRLNMMMALIRKQPITQSNVLRLLQQATDFYNLIRLWIFEKEYELFLAKAKANAEFNFKLDSDDESRLYTEIQKRFFPNGLIRQIQLAPEIKMTWQTFLRSMSAENYSHTWNCVGEIAQSKAKKLRFILEMSTDITAPLNEAAAAQKAKIKELGVEKAKLIESRTNDKLSKTPSPTKQKEYTDNIARISAEENARIDQLKNIEQQFALSPAHAKIAKTLPTACIDPQMKTVINQICQFEQSLKKPSYTHKVAFFGGALSFGRIRIQQTQPPQISQPEKVKAGIAKLKTSSFSTAKDLRKAFHELTRLPTACSDPQINGLMNQIYQFELALLGDTIGFGRKQIQQPQPVKNMLDGIAKLKTSSFSTVKDLRKAFYRLIVANKLIQEFDCFRQRYEALASAGYESKSRNTPR